MTTGRHASIGLLALAAGAACVFAQDSYVQIQDLHSPAPAVGDAFGTAVALFSDDAAIATFLSETVYTYERDSDGQLVPLETLTVAAPGAFGESLSLGGAGHRHHRLQPGRGLCLPASDWRLAGARMANVERRATARQLWHRCRRVG